VRLVYIAQAGFLETSLSLVERLAQSIDVVFVLWVAQESWETTLLGRSPRVLRPGIHRAEGLFCEVLPPNCAAYWSGCRQVYLASMPASRATDPRSLAASSELYAFVDSLGPDVVHLDDCGLRLAWGSSRLRTAPIVCDVHDPVEHTDHKTWRSTVYRRHLFPRVSRFVLHNRAQLSQFCRQRSVPAESVDVIRIGVYKYIKAFAAPDTGRRTEGCTVLFFGNHSPYKGVRVLLGAARRLHELVPQVRIVIAGRSRGDALRKPDGLPDCIDWQVTSEHVPPQRVAELLAASDVVALPYLEATQSGVLLSAFALRKPVVATRVGGLPEYVSEGNTGLLVDPGNASELADALAEILTHPELRAHMHESIDAEAAGPLSWSTRAELYLDVYDRAVRNRRPR
jgi:glycosyltransferase involved in cell wall biosynthesis